MGVAGEGRESLHRQDCGGRLTAPLEWEAEVSLFRSRLVLRQLALALGIPVLVVVLLLSSLTGLPTTPPGAPSATSASLSARRC